MSSIPRPALVLGLAGLIPFAVPTGVAITGSGLPLGPLPMPSDSAALLTHYGTIIMCFMSGALWGFATRADAPRVWWAYGLSVVPALWALFLAGGPPSTALPALLAGFVALLPLDAAFQRWGLAPPWWLRLRLLLTAGVALCLGVGMLFA